MPLAAVRDLVEESTDPRHKLHLGSLGEAHAEKIQKIMDLAYPARAPLIGIKTVPALVSRRAFRPLPVTAASSSASSAHPA